MRKSPYYQVCDIQFWGITPLTTKQESMGGTQQQFRDWGSLKFECLTDQMVFEELAFSTAFLQLVFHVQPR
jgi:hypothetical protein